MRCDINVRALKVSQPYLFSRHVLAPFHLACYPSHEQTPGPASAYTLVSVSSAGRHFRVQSYTSLQIIGATVKGSLAATSSGGVTFESLGARGAFHDVAFDSCTSAEGGAISNTNGQIWLLDAVRFNNNTVTGSGGAIQLGSTSAAATIGGECVFTNNRANRGGAINGQGTLIIGSNLYANGNVATGNDGGFLRIENAASSVTIGGCVRLALCME